MREVRDQNYDYADQIRFGLFQFYDTQRKLTMIDFSEPEEKYMIFPFSPVRLENRYIKNPQNKLFKGVSSG